MELPWIQSMRRGRGTEKVGSSANEPCPAGTACSLDAICVARASGNVCADFCQVSLNCVEGEKAGCVALADGRRVCADGVAGAGESCTKAPCPVELVCLDDGICHELCTLDADCPAARPSCLRLKSGRTACGAL